MSKQRRNAVIRWTLLLVVAVLGAAGIYLNAGGTLADLGIGGGSDQGQGSEQRQGSVQGQGIDAEAHAAGGSSESAGAAAQAPEGDAIRTPVRVSTPERGTLERTFTISGYVESDQVVTVTPKVQGSLDALNVDLGTAVEEGQVIAQIDDDTYRLDLKQAEANYAAARSTFQRTQDLFESDATSRQNLDQARSQFQAAQAQLELARLQLGYTSLEAPIAGTVIRRHTSAGSVVGTTSAIVTIADLSDLVVHAKIPEQHFSAFDRNPGEIPVRISLPAIRDDAVTGAIRTVSPYVSPSSRNFDVVVDLDETGAPLRPGMFVEVTFVLDRRDNVLSLPFEALSDDGELWYLREDGTVAAVRPEPEFSTQERFVVSDDWSQRRVVVEGQNFLSEGQRVTVVEDRRQS
jgi:RND family efflux transporter MFP subunit